MRFIRSRFGAATALAASMAILSTSCGDTSGVGSGAGAIAPAPEAMTTTRSTIVGTAFAYNYLYGQSPDPSATDSSDEGLTSFLGDIVTLAKDAKSIAGFVSGIVGGINAGISILQFLGLLPKPPDEVAL